MEEKRKIEVKYKSALPIWAAAAVWVIAALFFPMYKVLHFIVIALVSIACYAVVRVLCPTHSELVDAPPPRANTGSAEIDVVLNGLYDIDSSLYPLEKIAQGDFRISVENVRRTLSKIAEALKNDPSDYKACKKLLSFYLPTVTKMADKYIFFKNQGTSEKNVLEILGSIEDAFKTVDSFLVKQLDALFENDALDISTDITVLEALLSRDELH